MDTIQDIIRRVAQDPERNVDLRLLARDLGVKYRSLMYWISGDAERRFPVQFIVPFCRLLDNYEALDHLEHEAGRLAFPIPEPGQNERTGVLNIQRLLKEVAEAVGSVCSTIEDGVVEEKEAQATISEIDDVIRHCALMRYWLQQQTIPKPAASRRPRDSRSSSQRRG